MKKKPLIEGVKRLVAKLRLTKWTATQPVTKRLKLRSDGSIEKVSTAAQLYDGTVKQLEATPADFAQLLGKIGPNDCLSYGVPLDDEISRVMSRKRFSEAGQPKGIMTRTLDTMRWPSGPGILQIDYDLGERPLDKPQLLDALYKCCPPMQRATHIWSASTSSCLYSGSKEVRGVAGQRVYIVVSDATDIPRAADVIFKRLWKAGYGEIKISKAGSMLVRGPIDLAVFQPNRIDYCAPAICEPPLRQRKPRPECLGDRELALDTAVALPDLTDAEEQVFKALVAQAKAAKAAEAHRVHVEYKKGRVAELVAGGCDESVAEKTINDALTRSVLGPDFVLTSENGGQVTVAELLDNRAHWHGVRFADPLEPDYHHDGRIARAYLTGAGRPHIHSFAHGGQRYELSRAAKTIHLVSGQRAEYVQEIIDTLRATDEFYSRDGRIVTIAPGGAMTAVNEQQVLATLDRVFRFERHGNGKTNVVDAPQPLARQIRDAQHARFRPIRAIVTGPAIDPATGRLLVSSGYDEATGIYFDFPDDGIEVPADPSIADVVAALRAVWWPVREFPYVDAIDESVMLAGQLTACVRPLLPTSPAFGFDAPIQASGKTLLLKVLSLLRSGHATISPLSDCGSDDEMRKRILASAMEAKDTISIDNIVGEFDSPALGAYLTSEDYSDRVLGASASSTAPNTSFVLMSGNNLTLKGDLSRRVLVCRIDPGVESPHKREFNFDPATVVRERRQELLAAAVTLLRAAWVAAQRSSQRVGKGRLASFEAWDDAVRQAVCWLAELQKNGRLPRGVQSNGDAYPRLVDPTASIDQAVSTDPTRTQLARLLAAWGEEIGTGPGRATARTVSDLIGHRTLFPMPQSMTNQAITAGSESLHSILVEIAGNHGSQQINPRSLGKYLSKKKDLIVNGLALRQGDTYQRASIWWVEDVSAPRESGGSIVPFPVKTQGTNLEPREENKFTKLTKLQNSSQTSRSGRAAASGSKKA